ncbi:VOC family protein [Synechococcus sp. PCC 7336]|uniref:VOC family protein n=1 Tax=Synechococcus sp. PCC 7336 TaxID=195250 RepID=UPI000347E884|nr:VOC family protein [Synechococcus sp. PCC 7336]
MNSTIFHLAFPIADISRAKSFYADGLGCQLGRETPTSVILNLYGNQLVAHVTKESFAPQQGIYPRHFGLVFAELSDWETLLERARHNHLSFYQEPKTRFAGEITEHRTFFLRDPFYNLLEFKFYTHPESVFGAREFSLVGDRS